MTSSPTQPIASASAAPAPQAVVDELVRVATKHATEQLMPMVNRMVAVLLDLTAQSDDPAGASQRIRSGNLIKNNSYAFFHLACSGLEQALRKEVARLAPPATPAKPVTGALALVPLEEMDNKIAFGAITRPFDIACSEQLATLGVRLGLLLGRDMLRADQNPFRPEVFLSALNDAWREFEPEPAAHGLVLPLLRPGIVFDFAPMFDALNQALARKGQPDAARFRKTDGSAAARAARAGRQAELAQQLKKFLGGGAGAAGADDIPLIPDLPDMPQGTGGWRPSAAAGFSAAAGSAAAPGPVVPGAASAAVTHIRAGSSPGFAAPHGAAGFPAMPGQPPGQGEPRHPVAPLLDLLAGLPPGAASFPFAPGSPAAATGAGAHNVFYLPHLKQSLPQGSLSRSDENTLDLLSRIFETVLLDESIAPETRELIRFLQVPVLKAALRDNSFFFEEAHPARRMIDLLSRMGWEQRKGRDDPLFQAMQRSVDRIGREGGATQDTFEQAVADLESSISADERAVEAAIAEPIAHAIQHEKQVVAARSAREAIAVRIGAGDVVAVVSAFLENKWTAVLTLAYSIEDEKPGAVGNATRTMDDLIWSVKPKATQEQRKALIARLPGLLTTLNKWLDAIGWQDAERLQFFARLAECHASIVRAPIDASPERQLELAVEAAQQDALRRVALENAAAARAAAPRDDAELAVESLERGMWLAFAQPDGSERKLKLSWVSPLRTLFIFSAAGRRDPFSMPAEKLLQALRAGKVKLLAAEGVVGRVLSEAMQQAANDEAAAA